MTVGELIYEYEKYNPNGYFFDRDTLKFFGERVSEMRILKGTTLVKDYSGKEHWCYVLSTLQRNHPCGARRCYAFFDRGTYEEIIPQED